MHTKLYTATVTVLCVTALATAYMLYVARAYALFSADVEIRNNIVKTGSVAITVTPNEALFTADALLPGQTITNTLDIQNTGKSPVLLTLSSKKSAGYSSVYDLLRLTIRQGELTLYDGLLKDVVTVPIGDTALLPTVTQHLETALTLPTSADNTIDNLSTTITLTVHAQQSS